MPLLITAILTAAYPVMAENFDWVNNGLPSAAANTRAGQIAQKFGITAKEADDIMADEAEIPSSVFQKRGPAMPPKPVRLGGDGTLTLIRANTLEKITVRYRSEDGKYNKAALAQINNILRCRLTNQEIPVPISLVEVLDDIEDHFAAQGVNILSGYRSPRLNGSVGGAKKSLHMLGWAADITIAGIKTRPLADYAKSLKKGGVGFYPKNGFVHVDVGNIRYWNG